MHSQLGVPSHAAGSAWQDGGPSVPPPAPLHAARQYCPTAQVLSPHFELPPLVPPLPPNRRATSLRGPRRSLR